VQPFRQLAHEENPSIQMIFPMAEVVGLPQEGVGHLLFLSIKMPMYSLSLRSFAEAFGSTSSYFRDFDNFRFTAVTN
jgi:hypothetical protein